MYRGYRVCLPPPERCFVALGSTPDLTPMPVGTRKAQWWCIHNDPCGLCCVCVTYGLLIFADYVVDGALLYPWLGGTANYYALKLSFWWISLLAMISHARTMCTDPGTVPLEYQPGALLAAERGSKMPMCSRCNGFKPPRAHHCSQCDRCVMKMNHHCPWVNNCVGANNQKHFVLFCMYTMLLSGYAMVLLACRACFATEGLLMSKHGKLHGGREPGSDPAGKFLLLALLFFEVSICSLANRARATPRTHALTHAHAPPQRTPLPHPC